MFGRDMTLFNSYNGTWRKTVLKDCNIHFTQSKSNSTQGNILSNTAEIYIHFTGDFSVETSSGTVTYIGYKDYEKLSDPSGYITFSPQKDFFYDGVFEDLDVEDDDNYEEGYYEEVLSNYGGVYQVTSVAVYKFIPHFVVGCR